MCGSSSPVGIFHWSTCSFRAFTSSISPGTLRGHEGGGDCLKICVQLNFFFHHKFHWIVLKFWAFSPLARTPVCILAFLFGSFYMTSRQSLSLPLTWKFPPFDPHLDPKPLQTGGFAPREVGCLDIVLSGAPSPLPRRNQTLKEWKLHSWHAGSPLDKVSVNPGDEMDIVYIGKNSFTISKTSSIKLKTCATFKMQISDDFSLFEWWLSFVWACLCIPGALRAMCIPRTYYGLTIGLCSQGMLTKGTLFLGGGPAKKSFQESHDAWHTLRPDWGQCDSHLIRLA